VIDLSSKTFLVFDHGFFLPLARRLAQSGARVLYKTPYEKAFPSLNEGVIGDGFGDIQYCADFWPIKKEIDCFVFPDIYHAGLQMELRSQGFAVWGAGNAMALETNRLFFLNKLKELGLDVAPHVVIEGITALREFLKDKKDIFIKVSKWRGSWETCRWRSWKEDSHRLDYWAVKFGGVKEKIRFICFPKIDTKLEIGADTYNVDGIWPAMMLHGIEQKDCAYFSAVTPYTKMPPELTHIMEAFSPFLREQQYRQQWSMEVRVTEDKNFFIDSTNRGGLPSTGSFLQANNVPEVIFKGAHGEFVEVDYGFKYSAECMVKIHGEPGCWETIVVPDELKPHLMFSDCCEVDGQIWFPADEGAIEEVGWLVATGDTPKETAEQMNLLADMLPDGADAAVESLADIIREIEEEEAKGIKFTDAPMPDPEIVLQPS
jgi:hypothetical protein